MKKKLYKTIQLKSGINLPKGAYVDVEPHPDHDRLAIVTYEGTPHILRYSSVIKHPSVKTLEKWEDEGHCKTPAGKFTEPDGHDDEGFPSWLKVLGYI
jgi:hypothetical protein